MVEIGLEPTAWRQSFVIELIAYGRLIRVVAAMAYTPGNRSDGPATERFRSCVMSAIR